MKKLFKKMKKLATSKRAAIMAAVAVMTGVICAVGAHAEGEPASGSSAIQSAVTTALATTQNDAMTLIASVLPYALAIVGAVLVVTIGIKVFKKVSGR